MRFPRSCAIAVLAIALSAPAFAAEAPTKLDTLIQQTAYRLEARDGRLAGPGAEWLIARARESRYVLLGEDHGNAGMARFAQGLSTALAREGYRYTAVEVDPVIAADLERLLRDSDPAALRTYLQQDGHALAVPFYSWAEEADFLRAAVRSGPAGGPALWGLDQAFIGAAYVWLKKIEALARSPGPRAEAARLAGAAKANIMSFLGTVEVAELEGLRDALATPDEAEARALADQLARSARIYGPFVRGGGSVHAANLERETLMKRLFLEQAHAAERRDGTPPKTLFKFGANHMTRGLSPTHVPSLGNFVYELAGADGAKALSVLMVLGPGSSVVDFMGNVTAADGAFAERFGFLAAHVANPGLTVIDLAPWKDRPRAWAAVPADVADAIWAYDALLVVSGEGPATFVVPR